MADLVVTISESVTVNGALRGSTNNLTVTGITDTFERVVTCPHSSTTTIATFSSNVYDSAGAIDTENVKYIRVSNLSTTHDMYIGVAATSYAYSMLIPAGVSHIIGQGSTIMVTGEGAVPIYEALKDLTKIEIRPFSENDVDAEIFVASS
tara:strand:- start:380 stop:829 length:450 start_codon:yes stop_codon:yes gene_type:complete